MNFNPFTGQHHTWRDLFEIAVRYRRLVDPEYPVLWLDKMPDHRNKDGYKTVITLVRYLLFLNPHPERALVLAPVLICMNLIYCYSTHSV